MKKAIFIVVFLLFAGFISGCAPSEEEIREQKTQKVITALDVLLGNDQTSHSAYPTMKDLVKSEDFKAVWDTDTVKSYIDNIIKKYINDGNLDAVEDFLGYLERQDYCSAELKETLQNSFDTSSLSFEEKIEIIDTFSYRDYYVPQVLSLEDIEQKIREGNEKIALTQKAGAFYNGRSSQNSGEYYSGWSVNNKTTSYHGDFKQETIKKESVDNVTYQIHYSTTTKLYFRDCELVGNVKLSDKMAYSSPYLFCKNGSTVTILSIELSRKTSFYIGEVQVSGTGDSTLWISQ